MIYWATAFSETAIKPYSNVPGYIDEYVSGVFMV